MLPKTMKARSYWENPERLPAHNDPRAETCERRDLHLANLSRSAMREQQAKCSLPGRHCSYGPIACLPVRGDCRLDSLERAFQPAEHAVILTAVAADGAVEIDQGGEALVQLDAQPDADPGIVVAFRR